MLKFLTQIKWNFLKVLDSVQYPLDGYKYLNEIIFYNLCPYAGNKKHENNF